MSGPRPQADPRPPWYARPRIVLPIVGALIVASALVTQEVDVGRGGDQRLSTYSAAPMGGRMFYELARQLGWSVERRTAPGAAADSGAIIAVLDPPVPLRVTEVHALLQHVRGGGALLLMLGDGTNGIADSLGIREGPDGTRPGEQRAAAEGCPADRGGPFDRRFLYTLWPGDRVTLGTIAWRGRPPAPVTPFVAMDRARSARPRSAAAGFPFGRGRMVVGADPDLLRNDALRVCKYGLDVSAVRMLEYLSAGEDGPRRRIVFDEYHQGYGTQRGTMGAVARYLIGAGSGRLLVQLLAAGLLLLLAVAPRLIPPADEERVERRSPLEHVDALGRAYAQVGATRSAAARLLHGVRRRLAGGAVRPEVDASDEAFLERARRDAPQLADAIALIGKALKTPVSRREFAAVGAALEQLELSLTRM